MMQPRMFLFLYGLMILMGNSSLLAADDVAELLVRVPAKANVLAVVDVDGMFKSPLGVAQKWSQRYRTDYASGLVPFPPSVQRAVLAAELNPESLHPSWELGVLKFNRPVAMKDLATREMTNVDKFEGRPLITTVQHTYLIELKAQTIAVANCPNRQDMARWMRFAMSNTQPVVSDYLRAAAEDKSPSQFRLALDLQDIPHLEEVRFKLDHVMPPLPAAVDRDALAKIITGIQGLRVDVQIKDNIQATVRLDFADNLEPMASVLPGLALYVMQKRGVDLPELHTAKSRVESKAITFRNELSEASFRRLLSLLQPYSASIDDDDGTADPERKETVQQVTTTRYLRTITTTLNDLERDAKKAKTYQASAHWFETAAKNIDQLSVRNVDPDVHAYATSISLKLRSIVQSLKGVPLDVKALEYQKKQEYYVYPDTFIATPYAPYGLASPLTVAGRPAWVEYKNNYAEVQAEQARVIAEAAKDREQVWNLMQGETAAIRSKMTKKYNSEF